MIQKMKEFLFKDVKNENETKKVSIILRLNALTMCAYFFCLIIALSVTGELKTMALCLTGFVAYVLAFCSTYINKTKLAVLFAQFVTVCWVVIFVVQLGWDCGVQHFIFVLLVLVFTVHYGSVKGKIVIAAIACILRLVLYTYVNIYEPHYILSKEAAVGFQIINTIFIFIALSITMVIFTYNSQEMEHKLVLYNEKLHKLASIDALTGLQNRRSMREYLEEKENEGRNGKIDNLSIAIGDIDFFKRVNDTYGHEGGDVVLKELANIFKNTMGERGMVSRWGGEEFLFVFNNINGDEAMMELDHLRRKLKVLEIPYKEQKIKVTMTFGLVEFDFRKGADFSINEADNKLYRGKEGGRDRIVY